MSNKDRLKALCSGLEKSTLRGVRKCPNCCTLNDIKSNMMCKNKACDQVLKEAFKKRKTATEREEIENCDEASMEVVNLATDPLTIDDVDIKYAIKLEPALNVMENYDETNMEDVNHANDPLTIHDADNKYSIKLEPALNEMKNCDETNTEVLNLATNPLSIYDTNIKYAIKLEPALNEPESCKETMYGGDPATDPLATDIKPQVQMEPVFEINAIDGLALQLLKKVEEEEILQDFSC